MKKVFISKPASPEDTRKTFGISKKRANEIDKLIDKVILFKETLPLLNPHKRNELMKISELSHKEALELLENIRDEVANAEDANDFCLWLVQDVFGKSDTKTKVNAEGKVDVVKGGVVIGKQG